MPASDPLTIDKPDADGYFTYEPPEVTHPDVYEIWWGDEPFGHTT